MSQTFSPVVSESCTPAGTVSITASPAAPSFDPLVDRMRATWTAGDFRRIAAGYAPGAATFVERLSLRPGEQVLDVACGTGNLTLPAAKAGARVIGLDIAPNLLETARAAAAAEALDIRFELGNAETLPFDDGTFDTVMSMFGVMFSLRPDQTLSELVRVTRPGGTIALANWTPAGFVGQMLRLHVAKVPPPPGTASPLAWGDEPQVRQRLQPYAGRIRRVQLVPRTIRLAFPVTPGGVVELFREFYGPTVRTFGALDAAGRAALTADLVELWTAHNASPNGSTAVDAEYLDVRIDLV